MAKAVFTTKINPSYKDLPELMYHFPKTYLRQATAAIGDWILYYLSKRYGIDPIAIQLQEDFKKQLKK